MLSDFRKRFLDPLVCRSPEADYPELVNDTTTNRQTVCVSGCTCDSCAMRSEIDGIAEQNRLPQSSRSRCRPSSLLPSLRSVTQALYPPSYRGTLPPFPGPPSYSPGDSSASPAREDDTEILPLMSSTTTNVEGVPLSYCRPEPLSQDPSLTGVPSEVTHPGRVPLVEPSLPTTSMDNDVPEEPLPAYSRFPVTSGVLGPYPPLSILSQFSR